MYYALSKNKGDAAESWDVYLLSVWRQIAQNNSGTWQYRDAVDAWQSAAVNSRLGALTEAFGVTENQMDQTALEAIATNFASWFAAGTLDFACGLQADGSDVPTVDKFTVTYSAPAQDLELVLNAWEASANDPIDTYCVLRIKPNVAITLDTDLKAWVSMDDGANYEQVTGLSVFREIGDHDYVRDDISGLTPRTDKTMRLKVTSHNLKDVEIHAAALGVKH